MAEQQQVVIVGGGVIGLLTAFNLATQGQAVVLLERAGLGQESSWAGGGIVSPLYPWRYSPAVTALAHWSRHSSSAGIRSRSMMLKVALSDIEGTRLSLGLRICFS